MAYPPVSPWNQLPLELVTEIFVLCSLPFSSKTFHPSNSSLRRDILHLAQVCQTWRKIALSTPRLYSIVDLVLPLSGALGQKIHHLKSWLRLSRQCPLSLGLDFGYLDSETNGELSEISSLVLPHLLRLTVVQLRGPNAALDLLLSTWDSSNRLKPRSLTIKPLTDYILTLKTAPATLSIEGVSVKISFSQWEALEYLAIEYCSESEIRRILHQAANLQLFDVGLVMFEELLDTPQLPELVHNLHSFAIAGASPDFWQQVTFPALQSLRLGHHQWTMVDNTPLTSFLRRSNCPLTLLRYSPNTSEEDLIQLISHVPTLMHLTIDELQVTGKFFRLKDSLLKNLESLYCCCSRKEDFEWEALVPFLTSRSGRRGGSLQSFRIRGIRQPPNHDLADSIHQVGMGNTTKKSVVFVWPPANYSKSSVLDVFSFFNIH